jgi:hypothetical protein
MKWSASFAPALLLVTGLLAGCGSNVAPLDDPASPAASADQAEVAGVIAQTPEVIEDGEFELDVAMSFEASAGIDGSLEAIQPLRWWREIRNVERTFEFAFADTDSAGRPRTAVVTVHKRLRGLLHVVAGDPPAEGEPIDTSTVRHITKPLADHWVRRVLLHRVWREGMDRPRWRVVATSGVEVGSRDHVTAIQSLRIESAGVDTTITNPLAFQFLRRIVRLEPMAEVRLTATTANATDLVILYDRHGRHRFRNLGDGTHAIVFRTGLAGGLRHFGVNALSRGTLFDDAAPYDSHAWLLPYAVVPEELAAELP